MAFVDIVLGGSITIVMTFLIAFAQFAMFGDFMIKEKNIGLVGVVNGIRNLEK
jgi:hypothetical protein